MNVVMPYSVEAEQAVLGACITDRDLIVRLAPMLEPTDFFVSSHIMIWQSMIAMFNERTPIDVQLLTDHLHIHHPNYSHGPDYLVELMQAAPVSVHGLHYARDVRRYAMRRQTITNAQKAIEMAAAGDIPIPEIMQHIERGVAQVVGRDVTSDLLSLLDVGSIAHDRMGTEHRGPRIMSGIDALDDKLMGFGAGQLIVIAARPGYGKSIFGLQVAYRAARNGVRAAVANAEMSSVDTLMRLVTRMTGITQREADDPRITDDDRKKIVEAFGKLGELPVYLLECWHQSLPMMLATLRASHAVNPFGVVVVDYLGLFKMPGSSKTENRVAEVTMISRALKSFALECSIPVIALAQLNRGVEHRGGMPVLSDLRESGSIEQDADVVIFLHRDDKAGKEGAVDGVVDIVLAKNRAGETGVLQAKSIDDRFAITNLMKGDYR